jgi:hypothetical protein
MDAATVYRPVHVQLCQGDILESNSIRLYLNNNEL